MSSINTYIRKKYLDKWYEYMNYKTYIYMTRNKQIYETRIFLKYLPVISANKYLLSDENITDIISWFTSEQLIKAIFEPVHLNDEQQEYMKPFLLEIKEREFLLRNISNIIETVPYIRNINKSTNIIICPNISDDYIFIELVIFLSVSDNVIFISEDTIINSYKGCYDLRINGCNAHKYTYLKNNQFDKNKQLELVYGFYIPKKDYIDYEMRDSYTAISKIQSFETMKGRYKREMSMVSNLILPKLISMYEHNFSWCTRTLPSPISTELFIEDTDIELLKQDCLKIEIYDPNITYYFNMIIWLDSNIEVLNTELIQKYHIKNTKFLSESKSYNDSKYVLDSISYTKLLTGGVYRHIPDNKNTIIFTYILDVNENSNYFYYEGIKKIIHKGNIIITNTNKDFGIFKNENKTIVFLQFYYTTI